MSPRSITIFVRRDMGFFRAQTTRTDAIDAESATIAARRCAARHFEVPEQWVQLYPEGPHVVVASVERPDAKKSHRPSYAVVIVGAVLWTSLAVWLCSIAFGGGQ